MVLLVPGSGQRILSLLVLLNAWSLCLSAKILISLTNAMSTKSHSYNLAKISEGLIARGHLVTVLSSSNKGTIGFSRDQYNESIIYTIPYSKREVAMVQDTFSRVSFRKRSVLDYAEVIPAAGEYFKIVASGCESLFAQPSHLAHLKNESFDMIIGIPFCPCDALLAEYLNITFVAFTATFRYESFNEDTFGIPAPNSYVPFPLFEALTDVMSFQQRTYNFFNRYIFTKYLLSVWFRPFVAIQRQHNISTKLSIQELSSKAQLWLVHTSFALDFPRPTAPIWIPVGGLMAKPPAPLSQDLEDFVQGSGDHGVIVFSLGSMVTSLMNEDLNDLFAQVFSELPQRVLWRFVGPPPRYLGNNTRLMEWLPQNDLLGHPKTRLLIYHGGINGVYEAMYHKIPMVLLPIFADQPAIGARVTKKGMGVVLDRTKLTHQSVKHAITEVLNNPSYQASVEKYGSILRDSLASPLDTAVFWIEHVLKFGGGYLKSRATELNFFVLNSMDVFAFLLLISVVMMYVIYLVLRTCYRCLFGKKLLKAKSE